MTLLTANKKSPISGTLVVMTMIALFFGWLVTKDVSWPGAVLAVGFAIGGIILFFNGINRPELVTYVLVVYLPFSKVLVGDFGGLAFGLNFTNLLMIFIIVVWLGGRYAAGEPLWVGSPLNKIIAIFLVMGFISVCRGSYYSSGYFHYAIIEYKRWMTPFFLYYLVLNTVKTREMIRDVVLLICITTAIVGLMACYDYYDLGAVSHLEKARIGGICDQPNQLAGFFNYYMFLPFAFFLLNMNKRNYWLLLLPFLVEFRGIMVTFSRGGYLGFAMGLYAITWFRSKILFVLLLLLTVVVYFNPILLPAGIRYRMGQTVVSQDAEFTDGFETSDLEQSAQTRVEIWKAGIEMVKDHPLWGVGYGLFPYMIGHYGEHKWRDAHNTYLIIAAEMGIPSLCIFVICILMMIWSAWRLYRTTQDTYARAVGLGMLGGMFALLMSNMFGSRLNTQEVSSYLWILAALIMRLRILDGQLIVTPRKLDVSREEPDNVPCATPHVPRENKKLDACWGETGHETRDTGLGK